MNEIKCPHCGKEIELSEALTKDIEKTFIEAEHKKHLAEIEKIKQEANEKSQELVKEAKLEAQEQASQKLENKLKLMQEQSDADKLESKELRDQLTSMVSELREARKISANAELEMQKKLADGEQKIREEAQKEAGETQRLKLAEKDRQIETQRKQVEEMQRKLNQGSQQTQGEILELDLEESFSNAFRDDLIEPIAKGVNGADISQRVRSQSGIECGVILWELKRTKNWVDGWISKLKTDLRNSKANIPVIITESMPRQIDGDMGLYDGVWICKPKFAIILATLLRKGLLDVGREKAIANNRDTSADALYGFVTSHEFVQQIEAMVEVYTEMITDVVKEKAVYERIWAKRETQAKKLFSSTANIIGSMQGQIGTASMPKIKGLEIDLLGPGENEV